MEQTSADPVAVQPGRPPALVAAAVLGALEAAAIAAYAVAIGVAAAGAGQDVASAPVEIVIYLLFAAGIALVVKGLLNRRRIARGPYVVTQMFGLIIGWTLASGDGAAVHVAGWIVLVVSLAGLALMINRQVGKVLVD